MAQLSVMQMGDYRIDDLARAAGTTVRNVRAYQDRGLLPPPRRDGRVGWYSEAHLTRLQVIGSLLERGFTLANIAELLDGWDDGRSLADLVGFRQQLSGRFSDEEPDVGTAAEIIERYRLQVGDIDVLQPSIELGLVVAEGDTLRVPSPRLLRAGAELHDCGVPFDTLFAELGRLRRDAESIARRFVDLIVTTVVEPQLAGGVPTGSAAAAMADTLRRIRPLASTVVTSELARALQARSDAVLGQQLAQLVALDQGTVIAAGPPGEVLADPHVVASYLGTEVAADGDRNRAG